MANLFAQRRIERYKNGCSNMSSEYFDPAEVTLEEVIKRTMGQTKDVLYDDDCKMEDHPRPSSRFPGAAGWVEVNISDPSSPIGHVSYDIPYDQNGRFGQAVPHSYDW